MHTIAPHARMHQQAANMEDDEERLNRDIIREDEEMNRHVEIGKLSASGGRRIIQMVGRCPWFMGSRTTAICVDSWFIKCLHVAVLYTDTQVMSQIGFAILICPQTSVRSHRS